MQPGAIRVRNHRERRRAAAAAAALPPAASSSPPPVTAPSPAQAAPASNGNASPVEAPRVTLLETEVVTGPGADAFAAPSVLGGDEDGNGGVPLVAPAPPPPKAVTSPEEAAMLGKVVGMYCSFGWGLMAQRNAEALAPLVDTVLKSKPELAAQFGRLPPAHKVALGVSVLAGVVEDATAKVCLERNIRIPWQNEIIMGTGVGTATLCIVNEFKAGPRPQAPTAPRNDNVPPTPPPAARNAPTPPVTRQEGQDDEIDESPSARASGQDSTAELVL